MEASILLSSRGVGRYRVVGPDRDLTHWVFCELLERLSAAAAAAAAAAESSGSGRKSSGVSLCEGLGGRVEALGEVIEAHLAARRRTAAAVARLGALGEEARKCTVRLLSRFREKAPGALGGLESLVALGYESMEGAAGEVEGAREGERGAAVALESALGVFHALVGARFEGALGVGGWRGRLAGALPVRVRLGGVGVGDWEEGAGGGGWEECVDATLSALLKGGGRPSVALGGLGHLGGGGGGWEEGQASAAASAAAAAPAAVGPMPPNAGRVTRLLTVLLDRLAKASGVSAY